MAEQTLFDRYYQAWEGQTADYFEKLLRDPGFLGVTGQLFQGALRAKIMVDQLWLGTWRAMLLPNKRDQERTLHLLNELHSRLSDIEERLADLAPTKPEPKPSKRNANARN